MTALGFSFFIVITILFPALFHHLYVIPRNLFSYLYKPLDFGVQFRGNDLLGKTKTFRGIIVMVIGSALVAQFLSYFIQIDGVFRLSPYLVGAMSGLGYSLGELPTSIIKRRLGLKSSEQRDGRVGIIMYILEQLDSIVGVYLSLIITLTRETYPFYFLLLSLLVFIGIFIKVNMDMLLHYSGYKKSSDKPFFWDSKKSR